jgi:hypothetical protein
VAVLHPQVPREPARHLVVGLHELNPVDPYSLKALGFNP